MRIFRSHHKKCTRCNSIIPFHRQQSWCFTRTIQSSITTLVKAKAFTQAKLVLVTPSARLVTLTQKNGDCTICKIIPFTFSSCNASMALHFIVSAVIQINSLIAAFQVAKLVQQNLKIANIATVLLALRAPLGHFEMDFAVNRQNIITLRPLFVKTVQLNLTIVICALKQDVFLVRQGL